LIPHVTLDLRIWRDCDDSVTEDGCFRLRRKLGAAMSCALAIAAALAATISGRTATAAATLDRAPYGTTQGGQAIDIFAMTNDHGLQVRFLSFGGVITEIDVPDRGPSLRHRARSQNLAGIRDAPWPFRRDHRPLRQPYRRRAVHAGGQSYHLIANKCAGKVLIDVFY
jgi:hypothetical protein